MGYADNLGTKYSEQAVNALIKEHAVSQSSHSYMIPIPGGNDNKFLEDVKTLLREYADKVMITPKEDRKKLEIELEKTVDSKDWYSDEKSGVKLAASSIVRSIDRDRRLLVEFVEKEKSSLPPL